MSNKYGISEYAAGFYMVRTVTGKKAHIARVESCNELGRTHDTLCGCNRAGDPFITEPSKNTLEVCPKCLAKLESLTASTAEVEQPAEVKQTVEQQSAALTPSDFDYRPEYDTTPVYNIGLTEQQISNMTTREIARWVRYLYNVYDLVYLAKGIDAAEQDVIDRDFDKVWKVLRNRVRSGKLTPAASQCAYDTMNILP
jgi:hypothetical protein